MRDFFKRTVSSVLVPLILTGFGGEVRAETLILNSRNFDKIECSNSSDKLSVLVGKDNCLTASFWQKKKERYQVSTCHADKSGLQVTRKLVKADEEHPNLNSEFYSYKFYTVVDWRPFIRMRNESISLNFSIDVPKTSDIYRLDYFAYRRNIWDDRAMPFDVIKKFLVTSPLCTVVRNNDDSEID
jgi:hypothetical protein